MTSGYDWEDAVGRSWAEMYAQTDRSFAGLTQRLLERISPLPGETVLDIGCGAGELSLAIARARPRAEVIGLDVSAHLVAVAQRRSGTRETPRFVHGDAASWSQPGFAPDLLVSRHGVMFFDDPPAAFAHLHAIAAPETRMAFSCFRSPRDNRWATDLAEMLGLPPADPTSPGPFAFADPQRVEAILAAGGWRNVDCEPVDYAYVAGVGEDPVSDAAAFFARIGPAAAPLRALEGAACAEVESKLSRWLEAHRSGDMVVFGAAAWIVTAQRG
ncbi:MAG TPA: class I SAM-dependent methyltransferase [Novosphingobium sp.]|nr:class I SAM-dependent methyltransferase [Novosphingobium sp.]